MKIGPPTDSPALVGTPAAPVTPKSEQGAGLSATVVATKSSQSAGVAVTVSTLARTLEAAKNEEPADVDSDKVNAIRAAIAQGSFVVNAEAIADKMLANAQEILSRTRS